MHRALRRPSDDISGHASAEQDQGEILRHVRSLKSSALVLFIPSEGLVNELLQREFV